MSEPIHSQKYGQSFMVPRSVALMYSLIEPTEAERGEMEARQAESNRRTTERFKAFAAWQEAMFTVTDPLALKVLDLHKRNGYECTACIRDEMDNEDWPCETVRLVADHCGHPAPDCDAWVLQYGEADE